MVLITIVTGAYKPTHNWGAPHCRHIGRLGKSLWIQKTVQEGTANPPNHTPVPLPKKILGSIGNKTMVNMSVKAYL